LWEIAGNALSGHSGPVIFDIFCRGMPPDPLARALHLNTSSPPPPIVIITMDRVFIRRTKRILDIEYIAIKIE
jgi:hypothetical protein